MRAMVLSEPKPAGRKPLKLIEIPDPKPGPIQVRVRIERCGVCHTDLHLAEGDIQPAFYPIIPGHQVVGRVDMVGERVTYLKTDARVGIPWFHTACGDCEYCQSGFLG